MVTGHRSNNAAHRPAGRVAVLAIRSLDDLSGGAGRYRVNSSTSVNDEPRQSITVEGAAQLRAEVLRWLNRVLERESADG